MMKIPPYGSVSYDVRYGYKPMGLGVLLPMNTRSFHGTLLESSTFGPAYERLICSWNTGQLSILSSITLLTSVSLWTQTSAATWYEVLW